MKKATSPFKFLDAYTQEDSDIWFGRQTETETLYDALSGVKHLLIYGPSGAGKTSLIECGLRNQFSDADWFALTIRRGNNMTASVFEAINGALEEKINIDPSTKLPFDTTITFGKAIDLLFAERYQPVYLLFDQFEELLILGESDENEEKDERKVFFKQLNQLIRFKVPCRVMLIMREEFIGHLSEFEHFCPSIFQHRFRLEKMRKDNVQEVIQQTLQAKRYAAHFGVNNSQQLTQVLLSKLPDKKQEIELAHVQVFLDELWDRAQQKLATDGIPILSSNLIKKDDDLERILNNFLNKQLRELSNPHGKKIPLELLASMISERHTKLQVSLPELQKDLADKGLKLKTPLPVLLKDLENRRVIRTLKSGNKTHYEISHDLLALAVGQNLTEEIKMRKRAEEVYRLYAERDGYFTPDDLDYIRPFQEYRKLSTNLQKRMTSSEKHWKNEAEQELINTKKRLQLVRAILVVAVLALCTAGYFGWDANQKKIEAQHQRNIANQALDDFRKEEAEKNRLEFNKLEDNANIILRNPTGCPEEILQKMQEIADHHPDSIALQKKLSPLLYQSNQKCK